MQMNDPKNLECFDTYKKIKERGERWVINLYKCFSIVQEILYIKQQ